MMSCQITRGSSLASVLAGCLLLVASRASAHTSGGPPSSPTPTGLVAPSPSPASSTPEGLTSSPTPVSVAIQPAHRTIVVGRHPMTVVVTARPDRVLLLSADSSDVAVPGGGSVSLRVVGTGVALWTLRLSAPPGQVVVSERTARVFISPSYGIGPAPLKIIVLNMNTGTILRRIPVSGGVSLTLDERRGRVFAGNRVLDAQTGDTLGVLPPYVSGNAVVDQRTGRLFSVDGSGGSGFTTVLDLAAPPGPKMLLTTFFLHAEASDVAVDEAINRVFVNTLLGVKVLDAHSGAVLGTLPAGGRASNLLLNAQTHRLFISEYDYLGGGLSSVRLVAATGPIGPRALLRTLLEGTYALVQLVDQHTSHVLVGLTKTQVAVLDGRTGATLRTVTFPDGYTRLAMDPRTGRALLTNYQNGTLTVYDDGL